MRALIAASDYRCALFILPCVLAVVMSCRLARWCDIARRIALVLDAGQNLRHSLPRTSNNILTSACPHGTHRGGITRRGCTVTVRQATIIASGHCSLRTWRT